MNFPISNAPSAFFLATPLSVMIPSMSDPGVTSKLGFHTSIPSAATRVPNECVTSVDGRSSMTMSAPVAVFASSVVDGAATKNGTP